MPETHKRRFYCLLLDSHRDSKLTIALDGEYLERMFGEFNFHFEYLTVRGTKLRNLFQVPKRMDFN